MERHNCKLCTRTFANGKALGGHMKAHMATLPLPPKPLQRQPQPQPQLSESASASEDEFEEGPASYGLRENPRKSLRFVDPEFSFVDSGDVVQDRESETESRGPSRRRSKRNRTQKLNRRWEIVKNPNFRGPSWPAADSEPVSSVSDASPEENVAMCLMMLSRDNWPVTGDKTVPGDDSEEEKSSKETRGKYRCEKCNKRFRSHQALGSHRVTHKAASGAGAGDSRIFECPFCFRIFGSGQALGGHKRSHMMGSSPNAPSSISPKKQFVRESSIDLNLPAPAEEDSYSVVSDAGDHQFDLGQFRS